MREKITSRKTMRCIMTRKEGTNMHEDDQDNEDEKEDDEKEEDVA